jgi:hypothetical protein
MLIIYFVLIFSLSIIFVRSPDIFGTNQKKNEMENSMKGIFFLVFILITSFVVRLSAFQIILLQIIVIASVIAVNGCRLTFWKLKLAQKKLPFLRAVSLKLSAGESFRRALEFACAQFDQKTCYFFKTIVENNEKTDAKNIFIEKFSDIRAVVRAGQEKKYDVRGLVNSLRHKLELEARLEKKTRSATQQVLAQGFCLIFMFFVAVAYTIYSHGAFKFQKLLIIATFCEFFGILTGAYILKGFRWKM